MSSPPKKPLMFFDGDCAFCVRWIRRWQRYTGDRIDYAPSQDSVERAKFPELPDKIFDESVQLIQTDGKVFEGAEAVFRSLAIAGRQRWLLWLYEKIPGVAALTEWAYRFVARHRTFFSTLTRS